MKTHSQGKWSIGRTGGTVVTDNGDGFDPKTGHSEVEYYGGYLIAESIMKNEDAKLISAAPDLLEALERFVQFADGVVKDGYQSAMIRQAKAAIGKAKGEMPRPLEKIWDNSSTVAKTAYNEKEQQLFIYFRNGKSYQYNLFPIDEWDKLLQAESIGKYLHAHVKGNFEGISLD